jgi:hypothetical protein
MARNTGKETVSRTAIIPFWCTLVLGTSASIWVGFAYFDTTGLAPVWATMKASMIALGVGGIVACIPEVINIFCKNIWPRPELRHICADVWNDQRSQQIEIALQSPLPAAALRAVYKGDVYLEEFDSSTIYRSIGEMHEGAFLAAVHLWDPDNYDENFLITDVEKCDSALQLKIFEYRTEVAKRIKDSHIIAARRYRVKASSNFAFVTQGDNDDNKCLRLKSLSLLAENVVFDLKKGWIVDVEYCNDQNRHYPNLDYALLFGAQPPDGMDGTARVAYITDSREVLATKENYVGVQVNDPLIIIRLMKDRFWAFMGIKQECEFLRGVLSLITSQHELLAAGSSNCSKLGTNALDRVSQFLASHSRTISDMCDDKPGHITQDAREVKGPILLSTGSGVAMENAGNGGLPLVDSPDASTPMESKPTSVPIPKLPEA